MRDAECSFDYIALDGGITYYRGSHAHSERLYEEVCRREVDLQLERLSL